MVTFELFCRIISTVTNFIFKVSLSYKLNDTLFRLVVKKWNSEQILGGLSELSLR